MQRGEQQHAGSSGAAPATSSTRAVRTGSPLTRRRRRGGAAEALDDENNADLFDTWVDALNDAALASVAKLWAALIKYTLRCCTRTLMTEHERMGKRAQAADDA